MSDQNLNNTEELEISSEEQTNSDKLSSENDVEVVEEATDAANEIQEGFKIKEEAQAIETIIEKKPTASSKKLKTVKKTLEIEDPPVVETQESEGHSGDEDEVKSSNHDDHDDDLEVQRPKKTIMYSHQRN